MKKKPIFRKLLVPLMGLVMLEILILVCTVFGQGLMEKLNRNEEEVVAQKVDARKSYLESVMINNWMNLETTVNRINSEARRQLVAGAISLDTLDDSSKDSAPFLSQIARRLIELMRSGRVTGAFVVLNTEDLAQSMESGEYHNKPGIYLRDTDPTSHSSQKNLDILIERSPVAVVQRLGIATDTSWNVQFDFSGKNHAYYDFLYYPFQTAYYNDKNYSWEDMGYWSEPYELEGENRSVISYSVPLMLDEETVYGVLGIDISLEYLKTMLPHEELEASGESCYFVAKYSEEDQDFASPFGNGRMSWLTADGKRHRIDPDLYYLCVEPLQIYSSNAPFSGDNWVLAGAVSYEKLKSFVKILELTLVIAILVTLLIGVAGSLIISYRLQRPVARLAQEMSSQNPRQQVHLDATGIAEIDQMSEAVERLSQDVIESGRKFTQIIEMASVRLAGFQIDRGSRTLFLTENFFHIFGWKDIDEQTMTPESFATIMQGLKKQLVERDSRAGSHIFQVTDEGQQRFVSIRSMDDGRRCYGVAEDVTQALLEKRILRHERDHDSLTNLYNRRAFRRQIHELFEEKRKRIGIGAYLMLDLDNLKYINDTYGHEYGDRYIMQAAAALEASLSGSVCYARISGDEFNVFIYGCATKEEAEAKIQLLKEAFAARSIRFPDGREQHVQASGGIAWYPKDSTSFDDLQKFADYAMYVVKRNCKGEFREFDMTQFQSQDMLLRNRVALTRMLASRQMHFVFQPIVDAGTGDIFAYEALLRPDVIEFSSVGEVLETARREGKLNQIEEMTWFLALDSFRQLIQEHIIDAGSHLFLNSIPNQQITDGREAEFQERYADFMPQIVLELTEGEQLDPAGWNKKQQLIRSQGGRIALDDYGTGYNSEKTLLFVSPDFIKVDIVIVKDIHKSSDRQAIMEYIVNYAHERGKYIIAEGVENALEAETVIRLGADYLQGYFLARPAKEPDGISQESLAVIRRERIKREKSGQSI